VLEDTIPFERLRREMEQARKAAEADKGDEKPTFNEWGYITDTVICDAQQVPRLHYGSSNTVHPRPNTHNFLASH
jgi:hypothetical protein